MDDEDLLHLAIAVPIVLTEIDLAVGFLHGFDDHLGGMHVVAIGVVGSIVSEGVFHHDGSHHIEGEIELPIACVAVVIAHGADVDVVLIAKVVEEMLEDIRVEEERNVGELDENDQASFATCHFSCPLSPSHISLCPHLFPLSPHVFQLPRHGFLCDEVSDVVLVALEVASIVGLIEVEGFVAHPDGFNLRAVGKREYASLALRRHGKRAGPNQAGQADEKDS